MVGRALLGLDSDTETHRMSRISLGESRGESIPGRKELGSGPGTLWGQGARWAETASARHPRPWCEGFDAA